MVRYGVHFFGSHSHARHTRHPPISPRLFLEPRLPLAGASAPLPPDPNLDLVEKRPRFLLRWMEVCETQAAQPSSVVRTGQSSDRQGRWSSATPFGLAESDPVLEPPLFLPTAQPELSFCLLSSFDHRQFRFARQFHALCAQSLPQASLSSAFGPRLSTRRPRVPPKALPFQA